MVSPSLPEQLRSLAPGAELRASLRDCPLEELLLTAHESRFTGLFEVGGSPEPERLCFREGAMAALTEAGAEQGSLRSLEERVRRRVFALYERFDAPITIRVGREHLSGLVTLALDVRPVISFGFVVKSSEDRRRSIIAEAFGKRAKLLAPYDERRNGYGLPPPVLHAMRLLAEDGVVFHGAPTLPGLDAPTTAGLLLLLSRMSLLRFENAPVPARGHAH